MLMKTLATALLIFAGGVLTGTAEEKFRAQLTFNDTNTLVTVNFAPKEFALTADELENLIANLGRARENLKPSVPDDAPIGKKLQAVSNPGWYAPPAESTPGQAVLILRHPGFGWLGFAFSKPEARSLGNYLIAQSMN
jgi:hypothetical protein